VALADPNTRGRRPRGRIAAALLPLTLGVSLLAGCTRDGKFQALSMWNESRLKPYENSPASLNEPSVRVAPAGTIARGSIPHYEPVATGRAGGKLINYSPVKVDEKLLARGQQRYQINCAPCHGVLGDGRGMIVRRGFPPPPDYAIKRLREAPLGHYYDVISNGYGVMYSYADRVQTADRWAIAAYIRVLQKSRKEVPAETKIGERQRARDRGVPDPSRLERRHPEGAGETHAPGDAPPAEH
jgi:mono/diheme cytochrome c family protein